MRSLWSPMEARSARRWSVARSLGLLPVLPLVVALLWAGPSAGEIFRWTDGEGIIHFSDNLETVPPEHRPRVRQMDDRLPPPPENEPIPIEQRDIGYVVQATINGKLPVHLVLDTGASVTLLSKQVARRLGLRLQKTPPVTVRTAGGTVRAARARVEEIEVGGRRLGPLEVVIHDALTEADGLLGMDFLGAFKVEIHSEGPTLLLSSP